jgi:hypothetical protein
VRAARVDLELARGGDDHQVQVFHRDRADQHPVPHHQRADEAGAVLEADLERADVGHELLRAVGEQHLALAELLQPQRIADVLWNADVQRGGIGERIDVQRQGRDARVAEMDGVHGARIVTRHLETYYSGSRAALAKGW